MSARPLPDPEYADLAPFWAGTAREQLLVPACGDCGRRVWPPRMACPGCAGIAFTWRSVGRRGRLYSWTTIGRAMLAGFEEQVPYTVVVVESESDPAVRFVGNLRGDVVPEIGAPLEAVFVPENGVTLVFWRPV